MRSTSEKKFFLLSVDVVEAIALEATSDPETSEKRVLRKYPQDFSIMKLCACTSYAEAVQRRYQEGASG